MNISHHAAVLILSSALFAGGCGQAANEPEKMDEADSAVQQSGVPADEATTAAEGQGAESETEKPQQAAESDVWQMNGAPVADSESRKSKDGFGAQLFLTESEQFFEDWNKPEPPSLPVVETAKRNVPLLTAILFVGAGQDDDGVSKVTCHATIRKPDGSVYGEGDLVGWNGKNPGEPNDLQSAQDRMGIRIEPQDPAGTYTVEVTVRDEVKKIELPLKVKFEVEK